MLNHSGVPDPSGVSWTGHAVTGETIPVFPGETVVTNFSQMTNGSWLLQFSVENELPDRGETMSSLQIDHPCKPTILDLRGGHHRTKKNRVWSDMNPALDWLHADFNHTLVGACNEVYNLQPRHGDVARPLDMTISVADSAPRGDEAAWMVSPDWPLT